MPPEGNSMKLKKPPPLKRKNGEGSSRLTGRRRIRAVKKVRRPPHKRQRHPPGNVTWGVGYPPAQQEKARLFSAGRRVRSQIGISGQGIPASPWPSISQVLSTHGGRDSGRLGLSVRTWLVEAATAANSKGGLGGGVKAPQEKSLSLLWPA